MLGKLAKWLRISGLDVLYSNDTTPERLIETSRKGLRTVITRNTKLLETKDVPVFFIKHDRLQDQLRQFFDEKRELDPFASIFTRCIDCNTLLEEIDKEKIKDRLWPYVYQTKSSFRICPGCNKIYWAGTHKGNMEKRLRELLS